MRTCPGCDERMVHAEGGDHCPGCGFDTNVGKPHRRHDRRYKKVIRRLDRIGARLAGIRS